MDKKLMNSSTPSAVDIALGDKGYVSVPAPTSAPKMKPVYERDPTSRQGIQKARMLEDFVTEMLGLGFPHQQEAYRAHRDYTMGAANVRPDQDPVRVITVKDAFRMADDVSVFVARYGQHALASVVETITNGRGRYIRDLPDNAIEHFHDIIRRV